MAPNNITSYIFGKGVCVITNTKVAIMPSTHRKHSLRDALSTLLRSPGNKKSRTQSKSLRFERRCVSDSTHFKTQDPYREQYLRPTSSSFSTFEVREEFVRLWETMIALFPSFPLRMLANLLLLEKGNFFLVATNLRDRGWTNQSVKDLPQQTWPFFTVEYYFGQWVPEYKSLLSQKGSYLTALSTTTSGNHQVVLHFIDDSGKYQQHGLSRLDVPRRMKHRYNLRHPICRPELRFEKLLPFCLIAV